MLNDWTVEEIPDRMRIPCCHITHGKAAIDSRIMTNGLMTNLMEMCLDCSRSVFFAKEWYKLGEP